MMKDSKSDEPEELIEPLPGTFINFTFPFGFLINLCHTKSQIPVTQKKYSRLTKSSNNAQVNSIISS